MGGKTVLLSKMAGKLMFSIFLSLFSSPSLFPSFPSSSLLFTLLFFFLQFYLSLLGDKATARVRSAAIPYVRPLSSGKQSYDTTKSEYPLTEPMPKMTAKLQVSSWVSYQFYTTHEFMYFKHNLLKHPYNCSLLRPGYDQNKWQTMSINIHSNFKLVSFGRILNVGEQLGSFRFNYEYGLWLQDFFRLKSATINS